MTELEKGFQSEIILLWRRLRGPCFSRRPLEITLESILPTFKSRWNKMQVGTDFNSCLPLDSKSHRRTLIRQYINCKKYLNLGWSNAFGCIDAK